ncbi:hypothetical protein [Candidatus Bathycorpusculum sp.]|uniref:MSCRAMM family protein n=1 Tax=Candidatus Bathycorpusculum sp. TaxID=2994959 RepID=UPI002833F85A|nr:hypothetical protein [Candidatus Termitimicrobium sp.]
MCLTLFSSLIFAPAALGDPVGNSLKDHDVWDPAPATLAWVHGNAKGYSEGQTAAFRVTFDDVVIGQSLWFIVELDLNASDAYAFTDIEPWDTTYQQNGVHLTPPPLASSLTGDRAGFNAAGAVIVAVDFLGYSNGYQSWNVTFMASTSGPVYVVYGGHIAASGDSIASGGIVPPGGGASHARGVFQARINSPGTGAKTINFNANDITGKPSAQSFTVTKVTLPHDTTTIFNFTTSISQETFSLTSGHSWDSGELAPGNYTVTELVPDGWDLTNVVIVDPDFGSVMDLDAGTVTVDLDPGEHITILFINTARQPDQSGLFTVAKLTIPSDASMAFNFVTSASDEAFSLTDNTRWYSEALPPGTYTVTELPQAGWALTDIQIDGTSNYVVDLNIGMVTFDLASNEHISIIFINTEQQPPQSGSFTVTKLTIPSGASTSFTFVTSVSNKAFTLTDGNSWHSGDIAPGNYTVTELSQAGWDLTNIIIVDPDGGSRVDLATGTVFIDLDPGETIAIFYQNRQQDPPPGSFTVTKITCPTGAPDSFTFVTSAPGRTFTLTDGTSWNSGPIAPGNYTVTEIAQMGWDLTNIIIVDPDGGSRVDLATGTVFIDLDPGESITIFYQNSQQAPQSGSISVNKVTCPVGSSGVFRFVTSAPPGSFSLTDGMTWNSGPLAPGRYTITELAPAGWTITNILVNDPTGHYMIDLSTGTTTIDLQAGSHVSIVYQNAQAAPQPGFISVVKTTCPANTAEPFTFVTSAPAGSFSLTNGEIWNSGPLTPGRYIVTEIIQAGWTITDIIIVDRSGGTSTADLSTGTATINLQPGAYVTIIYSNTKQTPTNCCPTNCECKPPCDPKTPL